MNTNASMSEELLGQLQGSPMQGLAQQLGIDSAQAQQAVGMALPMLFGALGQNAAQPQGAADLLGALQRDHSGNTTPNGAMDLGGLLGGLLGGGGGTAGGGLGNILGAVLGGGGGGASQSGAGAILGHIFGGNQQRAESNLGQATGLGNNAGQLLAMLAPLVMSFLAQRVQSQGMGASDLGQTLGQERAQIQSQGGMLGSLLDQNGDGKLDMGDLFKIGGSLLGGRR